MQLSTLGWFCNQSGWLGFCLQPQPHPLASCKSMKADRDDIVEWALSNKGLYACTANGPTPILSHTEPLNVTNALWGWRTILVFVSEQRYSCIAKLLVGIKTLRGSYS